MIPNLIIDTITLPGLETEVAVTDIRVSCDVSSHTTVGALLDVLKFKG